MIGDEGEQFGVMDTRDAIRTARETRDSIWSRSRQMPIRQFAKSLTLESFSTRPRRKRTRRRRSRSRSPSRKLSFARAPTITTTSYRMKHAREWLTEGDKVKATIWFRGREMTHRELGARILESSKRI